MGRYNVLFGYVMVLCAGWMVDSLAVMKPEASRMRPTGAPGLLETCTVPLMAGQNIAVGEVHIQRVGDNVIATLLVTDGYSRLRATHLYVGAKPPLKSAPGLFPFKHERLNTDMDVFVIPRASVVDSNGCFYVAAHAEVDAAYDFRPPDYSAFAASLPSHATFTVSYPGGGDSYLDGTISGGAALDGIYDTWCVDTDHEIMPGDVYYAEIRNGFIPQPSDILDFPYNIDLVNYILNAGFPGRASSSAGLFTWGDVQQAIWEVIEDVVPEGGAGTEPYDQQRVDEIVAEAYARGEGFKPTCNQLAAVLVRPIDEGGQTAAQITVIEVPLRCKPLLRRESAWGAGGTRFKTGWGSYFRCCP